MAFTNYGYTPNEWVTVTETKRQVIRNQAWEDYLARVGGRGNATDDRLSLRNNLEDGTGVSAYDSVFGTEFRFKTTTETLFSNTRAFLQREQYTEAQRQVDERTAQEIRRNATKTQAVLTKLRKQANTSYSGCDITPSITVGDKTFILGNISTMSYSIHRAKSPVRTLGRAFPKSYVSSGRTIAGTLVFNVFDTHVLHEVRKAVITEREATGIPSSPLTDQLPPFDITILYHNEYGSSSYMRIYGVEISDEGQTHSINDMYTENVMQYIARDIDLMVQEGDQWTPQALAASNLFSASDELESAFGTPTARIQNAYDNIEKVRRDMAVISDSFNTLQVLEETGSTYTSNRIEVIIGKLATLSEGRKSYIRSSTTWTEARKRFREVYDDLSNTVQALNRDLERTINEAESQAGSVSLGSSSARFHDSPYSLLRKKPNL